MNVFELFDPTSCDIRGRNSDKRTWEEYFHNKKELEKKGIKVILVNMINHPIEDSIPISNEMFFDNIYPENSVFCLYCHSGGSSGYVQMQLKQQLGNKYTFINLDGGIFGYQMRKMNN